MSNELKGIRPDRIVIDDPWDEPTPEGMEATKQFWREAIEAAARSTGPAVVIMANLYDDEQ